MTAIPLNVTESSRPWAINVPPFVKGDTPSFNINVSYADTVANDGVEVLYKDEKPVTNPSPPLAGSTSATGLDNNFITKALAATLPPGEYVLHHKATINGLVGSVKIMLTIQAEGASQ